MIDPRRALIVTEDLKAGLSANYAAKHAGCSPMTACRIRNELLLSGVIVKTIVRAADPPTRYDLDKTGRRLARTIYKNLLPMLKKEPTLELDEHPDIPGMTGRARQLFALFWSAPGRILDWEFLISQVWGDAEVDPANLRVQIYRLRRLIKPATINTYENPLGYSLPRSEREKIVAMDEIIHLPALPRLSIRDKYHAE